MATVQQSIEVNAPAQQVYNRLTQSKDYARFMEDVESVEQIDDTHLHWTTIMANRPVEWDAEITEQEEDRYIAWHNTSGPTNAGKVEVKPLSPDSSQVTFTLQSEPQQVPGSMAGYTEQEMTLRLQQDLMRMRDYLETGSTQNNGMAGIAHDAGAMWPGQQTQGQSANQAGSDGFRTEQQSGSANQTAPIHKKESHMKGSPVYISHVAWIIAGMAIGALSMFILDPSQGSRRRALARDQVYSASVKTRKAVDAKSSDLRNRAYGLRARASKMFS